MAPSLLDVGEKLHVICRRLFLEDVHPHFAGTVGSVSGSLFRAHGYLFIFDSGTNSYIKRPAPLTRLFSVSAPGYIITVLPQEVDLDSLLYSIVSGRLVITDKRQLSLEIHEFGQSN